mgnify:CR=1 FL=1
MTVRSWLLILVMEIVTVAAVMSIFQVIDKQIAGLIGGFIFSILGIFIGLRLVQTRSFLTSATFWWLFVYMFYSVLPMMITRLTNWGVEFEQLTIWGITGPDFHQVARNIYLILILATVIDLAFTIIRNRRTKHNA